MWCIILNCSSLLKGFWQLVITKWWSLWWWAEGERERDKSWFITQDRGQVCATVPTITTDRQNMIWSGLIPTVHMTQLWPIEFHSAMSALWVWLRFSWNRSNQKTKKIKRIIMLITNYYLNCPQDSQGRWKNLTANLDSCLRSLMSFSQNEAVPELVLWTNSLKSSSVKVVSWFETSYISGVSPQKQTRPIIMMTQLMIQ